MPISPSPGPRWFAPIPPMIHGATQSATRAALFTGATEDLWRRNSTQKECKDTVEKHKANLLFSPATRWAVRRWTSPSAASKTGTCPAVPARQHRGAVPSPSLWHRFRVAQLGHHRPIGSSETGSAAPSIVGKGAPRRPAAAVTID